MHISNPSAAPWIFHEFVSGPYDPTVGATWEDLDCAAIIGSIPKAILLVAAEKGTAGGNQVGGRKNGSAVGTIGNNEDFATYTVTVECDANGIIEIYSNTAAVGNFYILGYWI